MESNDKRKLWKHLTAEHRHKIRELYSRVKQNPKDITDSDVFEALFGWENIESEEMDINILPTPELIDPKFAKAIVRANGKEIYVTRILEAEYQDLETRGVDEKIYHENELSFDMPDTVLCEAWVARDFSEYLWLFLGEKPSRNGLSWLDEGTYSMELPQWLYPEVLWENEPLKITLLMKPDITTKQS